MAMNLTVPDMPAPGTRDAIRLEREFRTGANVRRVLKDLPTLQRWDFQSTVASEKAGYRDRQAAIARSVDYEKRTVPGLGRMVAAVDPRTYYRWLRKDPQFFHNKKNLRKFLQDNPECRVGGYQKIA